MWSGDSDAYVSPGGLPLAEIGRLLEAEILSGRDALNRLITHIAATDLMSRVLASARPGTLLLTKLSNIQVVNTAEVAGLGGVVFLDGNRPDDTVIARARTLALVTLLTHYSAQAAHGRLFGRAV
jgi:hypothetical protein